MTTESSDSHADALGRCIEQATGSVDLGGGPFGALVMLDGEVVASTPNRVTVLNDPTAHAEVEALREAGRRLGRPHLDGCVLYASCEPCPMCLAAAMWAHVEHIWYAAPHTEAIRAGFDDTAIASRLYGQARPVALPEGFLRQFPMEEAGQPFDAWLAKADRRGY